MIRSLIGWAVLLFAVQAHSFEPTCRLARVAVDAVVEDWITGVTLAPIEDVRLGPVGYGSPASEVALFEIATLGAGWISVTPFGRMDHRGSTQILHDFEVPVEANEERIRKTCAAARSMGLKVAIIPHVYVMSGEWRGRIDPGGEEEWEEWFAQYEEFVLRFARLAKEVEADLFSIGVEFKSSTNFRADRWREVISKVKSVYSGPLTYSANWDEADQVPFWDELDFIGVNAFWPWAGEPGDGYDVMKKKASDVARDLEALSYYFDRPVLFTEVGVKSAVDSALAPWEWPEHKDDAIYDEDYQAQAYDAIFSTFVGRDWFAGVFIWKYFSDPFDETQEARAGFGPRGKAAEEVLWRWFGDRCGYMSMHCTCQ